MFVTLLFVIDFVFQKNGRFLIVESKFNSKGALSLSRLRNGDEQMGRAWIQKNIDKMMAAKDNPGLQLLGKQLNDAKRNGLLDYRINILNSSGKNTWIKWSPK